MINRYPYTDLHELNLDYILAKIKEFRAELTEFEFFNTITVQGIWNISKQYPTYSIVTDNNIGYISIQPVPAGILINNTDYWIEIFSQIPTLANELVIMGDSYGDSVGLGYNTWSDYVKTAYPDAYYSCVGGTGFVSDVVFTYNFLTNLQNLQITDPGLVGDIFIFGGANDGNIIYDGNATKQDVIDRINAFCAYVKNSFPNATVNIAFIGWNNQAVKLPSYNIAKDAYITGASLNSNARYISGLDVIMKNKDLIAADLIHPTLAAGEILGKYIALAIQKKSDVHYKNEFVSDFIKNDALVNNVVGLEPTQRKAYYDGNCVELIAYGQHNGNADIEFRINATTVSYGTILNLGRFTNMPISYGVPFEEQITAVITTSGSVTSAVPAVIFIYTDGNLYIRFNNPGAAVANVVDLLLISPINIKIIR